jgi:P-loop Domain of unknown function (DUF2791)
MSVADDRKAIRSLRVGVVPSSHVLQLTVGVGPLKEAIDTQIAGARSGRHKALVISGEWGTGKSNLLSYLREYALGLDVAVSYLNLNGSSTPINHPQRFYHRIVSDLRLPGAAGKGVGTLLEVVRRPRTEANVSKWITSHTGTSELANAIRAFANGSEYPAAHVISGVDLAWADYAYKKEKALKRIEDLGGFLKSAGYSGFMIQFDELETVAQLWNVVSRRGAYKTLYRLSNLKNVWSVYAATERLSRLMDVDRWSGKVMDFEALKFLDEFSDYLVFTPPQLDLRLGREIVSRVEKLYRRTYPLPPDIPLSQVIDKWGRMSFSNPRRLIRHTIDHLDRSRPVPRSEA